MREERERERKRERDLRLKNLEAATRWFGRDSKVTGRNRATPIRRVVDRSKERNLGERVVRAAEGVRKGRRSRAWSVGKRHEATTEREEIRGGARVQRSTELPVCVCAGVEKGVIVPGRRTRGRNTGDPKSGGRRAEDRERERKRDKDRWRERNAREVGKERKQKE